MNDSYEDVDSIDEPARQLQLPTLGIKFDILEEDKVLNEMVLGLDDKSGGLLMLELYFLNLLEDIEVYDLFKKTINGFLIRYGVAYIDMITNKLSMIKCVEQLLEPDSGNRVVIAMDNKEIIFSGGHIHYNFKLEVGCYIKAKITITPNKVVRKLKTFS